MDSMKDLVSFFRFNLVRLLERLCGPQWLYRLLWPLAVVRGAVKKPHPALPVPAAIGSGVMISGAYKSWKHFYQNCTLCLIPDRLAQPEWLRRCAFSGLEAVFEARSRRQPSIIVVSHFGPYFLFRFWLQAAGLPTATLVGGHAETRSYLNRLKDQAVLFPGFPSVFHPHQLREVKKFLEDGNVLVIALDKNTGNQLEVPVDDHCHFRMATGAMRLAARHRARLFVGSILDENNWNFQIRVSQPVPEQLLSQPPDFNAVGKFLLEEMLPAFRAHPDHCSKLVFESFRPGAAKPTTLQMT